MRPLIAATAVISLMLSGSAALSATTVGIASFQRLIGNKCPTLLDAKMDKYLSLIEGFENTLPNYQLQRLRRLSGKNADGTFTSCGDKLTGSCQFEKTLFGFHRLRLDRRFAHYSCAHASRPPSLYQ